MAAVTERSFVVGVGLPSEVLQQRKVGSPSKGWVSIEFVGVSKINVSNLGVVEVRSEMNSISNTIPKKSDP